VFFTMLCSSVQPALAAESRKASANVLAVPSAQVRGKAMHVLDMVLWL
jgi:hypothetical protein